jgi:hypothetical protein
VVGTIGRAVRDEKIIITTKIIRNEVPTFIYVTGNMDYANKSYEDIAAEVIFLHEVFRKGSSNRS